MTDSVQQDDKLADPVMLAADSLTPEMVLADAALLEAEDLAAEASKAPIRRCIVTGALLPRDQLIRFVVGPDQKVWPDLQEKLPGRGLWVCCDAELVMQAVKKNQFAKAARQAVKVDSGLVSMVRDQLRERITQLLGLAKRGGSVIVGFSQVEPALKRQKIALLLIATDAGTDGRAKLSNKLPSEQIITVLSSIELGQAVGHDQLVYVGLAKQPLTNQIAVASMRFSAFTAKENIAPLSPLAQIGAELP